MSTDVDVPAPPAAAGPSAQELELIATQNKLLNQQIKRNEAIFGLLEDQIAQEDLFRGTPEEQTAAAKRQREITGLFEERTLKALKGEIPIDPGTERQFEREQQQLNETFRQRIGPGFETSSPFIEAKRVLDERQGSLREQLRRGEIVSSEAISRGRQGLEEGLRAQRFGQVAGLSGFNLPLIQGAGNVLSGVSGIQQRQLSSQLFLAQQQAQLKGQLFGAIGSGVGTATGLALGGGFGGGGKG